MSKVTPDKRAPDNVDKLTGERMMPVVQFFVLVPIMGLLVEVVLYLTAQQDSLIAAAYMLNGIALVGITWAIRHWAIRKPVRAACSVFVVLLLNVLSVVGNIVSHTPALIVAIALLTVDIGPRVSVLCGALLPSTTLVFMAIFSISRELRVIISFTFTTVAIVAVGVALGLVLSRYNMALEVQRSAIAERDEALRRAARQLVLEKDLMLAEERARAAHELHDGLGHRLTQIGMSLEFAERVQGADPQAAWEEIAVARCTARDATREMRTWVRALSPVRSEPGSGVAGLEAIAASFRGTGIEVKVNDEFSPRLLTEAAELLMYRTVQEGLTNALRHSQAGRVDIRINGSDEGIVIELTNDIDPGRLSDIPIADLGEEDGILAGFGLRGLEESATKLGGTISAGRDDEIFQLTVRLPSSEIVLPEMAEAS